MPWTFLIVAVVVLALLLLLKRRERVSSKAAKEYLRQGALVVDVRSAGEFTAGHIARAINIPLSEIESVIARKTKEKSQVLLLHCQSGMRSAQARKKLKALGYENSFDLGSYARAAQIVGRR